MRCCQRTLTRHSGTVCSWLAGCDRMQRADVLMCRSAYAVQRCRGAVQMCRCAEGLQFKSYAVLMLQDMAWCDVTGFAIHNALCQRRSIHVVGDQLACGRLCCVCSTHCQWRSLHLLPWFEAAAYCTTRCAHRQRHLGINYRQHVVILLCACS